MIDIPVGPTAKVRTREAARVATCNTIPHPSNAIDLSEQIAAAITTVQG